MPAPIRVVVVDDHEVFVDALVVCLADYEDLTVVGTATTLETGQALLEVAEFDVMVLDLDLAGDDGLPLAVEALRRRPDVGVVIVTGLDSGNQIVEAVQGGVRGWVTKTATANELVEAVRGVAEGETRIPADLLAGVLVSLSRGQRAPLEHVQGMSELTTRELEVLGCLAEGMSRTEIGELLHVSPNTVRTHIQSILHKLKVHSALAAVAIARRAGITGPSVLAQDPARTG
jgi:DNA-binding NarL/FixJ family response regulator